MKKKILFSLSSAALLAGLNSNVFASGFQSFETNASGLGNAYAGGAAAAQDASAEFDNPASIVRINTPEVDISGVAVFAHGKFTADSWTTTDLVWEHTGQRSTNPLGLNLLPSLHFVTPVYDKLYFGFGATVPFGYFTEYDKTSIASDFATKSKIATLNLNPSLAYKITDSLSVGAGFDIQYLEATLDRYVKCSMDSIHVNAYDWAFGYNVGLLYQFNDTTRAGLSYRSRINHKPSGEASSEINNGGFIANGLYTWDANTSITTPEMVLLSVYHEFTDQIAVMGSGSWTHWSLFDRINMHFTNPTGPGMIGRTMGDVSMAEDFNNSFRVALGMNYKINERWLLRFGTAFDQSPVNDDNRRIQLPDGNRFWLATGAQYSFVKYVTVNVGYAHLFIRNGKLNYQDQLSGTINGHYDHNYANLLGLQLNFKFE